MVDFLNVINIVNHFLYTKINYIYYTLYKNKILKKLDILVDRSRIMEYNKKYVSDISPFLFQKIHTKYFKLGGMLNLKIFIGSTSEQKEKAEMVAGWIEGVGHTPIVWWEEIGIGKYTMESLIEISESVDAAIFIFSADDKIWYRGGQFKSVRDNIFFEYGLFSGKLSRDRVVILRSGSPRIGTDLDGITYGDLDTKFQAKSQIDTWIKNIITESKPERNIAEIRLMNLSDAFNFVFSRCRTFDLLRVYAISTIKSVQMFRLIDDLKIKEAKVLLRKFSPQDWDVHDAMVKGLDNSIISWKEMIKKQNIDILKMARFNYHPDRGMYIFDDKYYIEGDLHYFADENKYEFQNKVMVVCSDSSAGQTWINAKIQSFDIIYRNYKNEGKEDHAVF